MDQLSQPGDQRPHQLRVSRPVALRRAAQPFDRCRQLLDAAVADRLARLARPMQLDEADPGRGGLGRAIRKFYKAGSSAAGWERRRAKNASNTSFASREPLFPSANASASSVGSISSEAAAARHSDLLAKCS